MTDQPTTEQHTDDVATPTGTPHADTTTANGVADGVTTSRHDPAQDAGSEEVAIPVSDTGSGLADAVAAVDSPTADTAPADTAPADTASVTGVTDANPDAVPAEAEAADTAEADTAEAAAPAASPSVAESPAGPPHPTATPAVVAATAAAHAEPRAEKPAPYVVDPALADTPPPPVRRASSDPGKWGHVDADGTVHVRTETGERPVGSWQAGEPAEGLAHFARRFDDVLTEVELIAARIATGHGDPKQLAASLRQHRESLAEAHVVGDLTGLQRLLDHLLAKADQAIGVARQAREAARQQATERKQALVAEAERIAEEATQWKVAGDRLREILDEWKTIRGVDRKTDDVLWKRFGKARDAFNRRRGSHFAEMDRQRAAAKTRKEEIVAEAERISTSDEWGPTAGRYKQLMIDWKAAGRAPKDADDTLWQRFRAAQDAFFQRRSSAFTERDSELVENATKKEALLVEAERIDPAKGGIDAARAALHRIQERWDAIGHVPRERMREFEQRLRQIEERVRGAADAQWRRTDPETEARVAQFRERVEQFETQARKARAAGDERRAKQADAQAAQWREWLATAERAAADR